jgi:hypothetical protein
MEAHICRQANTTGMYSKCQPGESVRVQLQELCQPSVVDDKKAEGGERPACGMHVRVCMVSLTAIGVTRVLLNLKGLCASGAQSK